jgi:hypothetical protein
MKIWLILDSSEFRKAVEVFNFNRQVMSLALLAPCAFVLENMIFLEQLAG